jgi:hypothetical protein
MRTNNLPLDGYAATISPQIANEEWHERIALNALVMGKSEADFLTEQKKFLSAWVWGPWTRTPGGLESLLAARMDAYHHASAHRRTLIEKHDIRYLITSREARLPYREISRSEKFTLYAVE